MPDFNVAEFFRQKRLQDQLNGSDPSYDPNSATAWLEHAVKFPTSPDVSASVPQPQNNVAPNDAIQFPQFTSEAAQAIGPTQPDQFRNPPIGPEEQAYREQLRQTPLRSEYHPSMLRRILGSIGGLGVGVNTSDPAKAAAAGIGIRDQPYNEQLYNFNQGLGIQQQLAQGEIGDVSRAATQDELVARRNAEAARAQAEEARRQEFLHKMSPEYEKFEIEKARAGRTEPLVITQTPEGGIVYTPRSQAAGQTPGSKPTGMMNEDVKAYNLIAKDAENPGSVDPDTLKAAKLHISLREKGLEPTAAFARVVKDTNDERLARGQKKMSAAEEKQLALDLGQKPPQTLMINPDTNKAFVARPGTSIPENARTPQQQGQMNTPTTATRGRGEAAQTAIEAGKDIQDFANQNRDKLGNIGDYWNNLVSNTPAADPTVEQFRGKVASWAAYQAAAHGFRASTVMKEFESRVGPQKNVDAIISAIQGVNDELQHAVDTGRGQSSDKTLPGGITLDEVNREVQRRKLVRK